MKRATWAGGWWRHAEHVRSPNCNARPAGEVVSLAIVHSISLPPGEYGGNAVHRLFTNRLDTGEHPYYARLVGVQVSAHFFVRRDGAVTQFVSCDDRAWHAGASHWNGRDGCNDWSIGIELEGLEGEAFAGAQYRALLRLVLALAARYPLTDVVGHEHVAPGRKQDPGERFRWQWLARALGRRMKTVVASR